jgi:D-tagatose-1,6-bisphosphate aldolase subunit GatZ/KbaZ
MVNEPHMWQNYYKGSLADVSLKRKFSYSDRWRYYAVDKPVADTAQTLFLDLSAKAIPLTLLHQFLPEQYIKIRRKQLKNNAVEIVKDKVKAILEKYYCAVAGAS